MERYRVGLILSAATLDTYKLIERYAKHPKDPMARLGFYTLLKRAVTTKDWNAVTNGGIDNAELFGNIYLGVVGGPSNSSPAKRVLTGDALLAMSTAEQDSLYTKLCASVGIEIDPQALVNKRKENKQT